MVRVHGKYAILCYYWHSVISDAKKIFLYGKNPALLTFQADLIMTGSISERYGGFTHAKYEYFSTRPFEQFMDGQIAQGRYSSASVYIRELIRADEKRKAEEQLEAKLRKGLGSPESELTAVDWSDISKKSFS